MRHRLGGRLAMLALRTIRSIRTIRTLGTIRTDFDSTFHLYYKVQVLYKPSVLDACSANYSTHGTD
jgi:hypothetical protein